MEETEKGAGCQNSSRRKIRVTGGDWGASVGIWEFPGGRAASRRRHQEGFMEGVAYSWVLYPGHRTGQEAFQEEGAL